MTPNQKIKVLARFLNLISGLKHFSVVWICILTNIHIGLFQNKFLFCGSSGIYDGSFSRTVIDGYGVTTYFLKQKGIEVYSEEEISMVAERIKMLENLHKK